MKEFKTRRGINNKIDSNNNKIKQLEKENIELFKQDCLLCDKFQHFTETEEEVIVCGRPKKTEVRLRGFVHWKENFIDEDTGKSFSVERKRLVKEYGEWFCDK